MCAARWRHSPTGGTFRPNAVVDLWWTLLRTRRQGTPELGDPWPVFKMREAVGARMIRPACPVPFEYDPHSRPIGWIRQRAKEIAAAVLKDILEQADEADRAAQAAGWTVVGPRRAKKV